MFDKRKCKGCKYSAHLNGDICCDYILFEGHMRGCYEGKECPKYVKRSKDRRYRIQFDGRYKYYGEEE